MQMGRAVCPPHLAFGLTTSEPTERVGLTLECDERTLESRSKRGLRDRGASLVEYALLLALIVVVCIGAVTAFGSATDGSISRSGTSLGAAN
jgi:pilus assembly protein Flp/PilA